MSTPTQNVPSQYQSSIPLPTGPDQTAIDAARSAVTQRQRYASLYQTELTRYQAALSRNAGDKKKVAFYNNAIANIKKEQAANSTALNTAQQQSTQALGNWGSLLQGDQRDAYASLEGMFDTMGLGSLAPKIFDYVKQGYGADTITLLLQDTPEYKQRFAANEARQKAGLAVLNPQDYLAAESAYRQILSSSGLPKGFYDNPADFTQWIAGDVSPTEIQDRVTMATQAVSNTDPTYRNALFQMYGVGEGDLAAYFLDPKTAEPILKKQAAAGAIGAAALRRGFSVNPLDMEMYAGLGITADQAEQAYGQISDSFSTMLGLANRYGTTWDQRQAEQAVFEPGATSAPGTESAAAKQKRLASQERAAFSGRATTASQGLATDFRQT